MKSKLIRLFAVVASVLVLAVALVVPMSADTFDSSNSLVESDWQYCTVVDFYDYSRLVASESIPNIAYTGDVYFILSVNNNRYSLRGERIVTDLDNEVYYSIGNLDEGYPVIYYYIYDNGGGRVNCVAGSGITIVDRQFIDVSQFSITIYHNDPLSITGDFDSFATVNTFDVKPSSTRITSVFTNIMDWITSGLNSVQGVFYANNQLTMLGTLAVIGVAIAVAFLLIGVLQRFLHLRG